MRAFVTVEAPLDKQQHTQCSTTKRGMERVEYSDLTSTSAPRGEVEMLFLIDQDMVFKQLQHLASRVILLHKWLGKRRK